MLLIVVIVQRISVMGHVLNLSTCGEKLNYKAIAVRDLIIVSISSNCSFSTLALQSIREENFI